MSYSIDANLLIYASDTFSPEHSAAFAFLTARAADPDLMYRFQKIHLPRSNQSAQVTASLLDEFLIGYCGSSPLHRTCSSGDRSITLEFVRPSRFARLW